MAAAIRSKEMASLQSVDSKISESDLIGSGQEGASASLVVMGDSKAFATASQAKALAIEESKNEYDLKAAYRSVPTGSSPNPVTPPYKHSQTGVGSCGSPV